MRRSGADLKGIRGRRAPRATTRAGARGKFTAFLFLLILAAIVHDGLTSAHAQATAAPPPTRPAQEDLRALAELLGKPDIQAWLKANANSTAMLSQPESVSASQAMGKYLDTARALLRRLADAIPHLPEQLGIIWMTLTQEFRQYGFLALFGPLAAFALLGTLAELLFRRGTAGIRNRITVLPVETVEDRLRAICWRTLYGVGLIGVFTLGSVGAFLAFDWPPLLQQIMLTYLIVILAVRLTIVGGRIILAPGAERFRILPMSTRTARYWFVWSAVLVGTFYFAKGTFRLVPSLGANLDSRTLVGSILSILLLSLALAALWRRPSFDGSFPTQRARDGWTWLISVYLVGVWLTVFTGETAPFDIGIVLLLVFLASFGLRLVVEQLLRTSDAEAAGRVRRPFAVVAFHRGLRIMLIAGGAIVVAHILDLDLTALAANDTVAMRTARALLDVIIIVLVADFIWQMARIWIDRRLSERASDGEIGSEAEARNRQRVLTLLPVLRHLLLVTIVAVASLTALSTVGVAVGPLVAGAGIFGIAVGFGAQSLVKDVISGVFFLFDDAFRVGEYVECGHIKGTVEAFSLRSLKLRHNRGALHTVPFSALSTITNYSRDWVVEKISIGVTYDTDLATVKRIVKEIGAALEEDPEFAPQILETLKMQGVEEFGDFAIRVSLKMTTRPGNQSSIRHHAYALIKSAFEKEGIQFAYPTVTVVGDASAGGATTRAAAKLGFDLSQPPAPAGLGDTSSP